MPLCSPLMHSAYTNTQCQHTALLLFYFYLQQINSLSLSPRSSPYDCHICQVRVFTLFNTHTKGMRSPSNIYFSFLASAICRTQNLTDGDDQALLASVCVARQSLRRYGGVAWCTITLLLHPVGIRDPLYKIAPEESSFDQLIVILTINSGGPGFSNLI